LPTRNAGAATRVGGSICSRGTNGGLGSRAAQHERRLSFLRDRPVVAAEPVMIDRGCRRDLDGITASLYASNDGRSGMRLEHRHDTHVAPARANDVERHPLMTAG
jgi:hypothetical protein